MNIQESLKSSDIEIAELAANLYYKEYGLDKFILELLKTQYSYTIVANDYIKLIKYSSQNNIFLKDPTRSALIDIK